MVDMTRQDYKSLRKASQDSEDRLLEAVNAGNLDDVKKLLPDTSLTGWYCLWAALEPNTSAHNRIFEYLLEELDSKHAASKSYYIGIPLDYEGLILDAIAYGNTFVLELLARTGRYNATFATDALASPGYTGKLAPSTVETVRTLGYDPTTRHWGKMPAYIQKRLIRHPSIDPFKKKRSI